MRETLFNWVRADLPHSRCLDLFAGSGALGFAALSQGAASVVMVDNNPPTVHALKANREVLDSQTACEIHRHDARQYLQNLPQGGAHFDLVFLDPPFEAPELASSVLSLLLAHDLVTRVGSLC